MRLSFTNVNITVLDDNDNAPVFVNAPYATTLPEGPVTTTRQILRVNATDADSSSNGDVVYSLAGGESGMFQLDSNTVSALHVEPSCANSLLIDLAGHPLYASQ